MQGSMAQERRSNDMASWMKRHRFCAPQIMSLGEIFVNGHDFVMSMKCVHGFLVCLHVRTVLDSSHRGIILGSVRIAMKCRNVNG